MALIAHAEPRTADEVRALARAVSRRLRQGIAKTPPAPAPMTPPVPPPAQPRRALWINPEFSRPVPPVTGVRGETFVPALLALVARDAGLTGPEVTGGEAACAITARLLFYLVCREATGLDADAVAWLSGGRAARRVREGCAIADMRRLVDDEFHHRATRLVEAATAMTGMDSDGLWPAPAPVAALGPRGGGSVRALVRLAAEACDVSLPDIEGRSRIAHIVRARQVSYWLLRRAAGLSLPTIARRMQGRDHSTVHHGIGKVEALRAADAAFRAMTDSLLAAAAEMTGSDQRVAG